MIIGDWEGGVERREE
uniref:Uncharacterized protein n=1 Tax=Rhizophora mucronata TaxID=61149 RepID=A0A2P2QCW7_RHIMU